MVKSSSGGFNSGAILRIAVALFFMAMGACGYIMEERTPFAGEIFNVLDAEWLTYALSTVILLAGAGLLVPMFIKGLPPAVGRFSGIVMLAVWTGVFIFKEIAGVDGLNGERLFIWIISVAEDLMIFFSILSVIGKKSA